MHHGCEHNSQKEFSHEHDPNSLTEKRFEQHVRPYISVAKRGYECSISLHKVFNYILYRLHVVHQDIVPKNRTLPTE